MIKRHRAVSRNERPDLWDRDDMIVWYDNSDKSVWYYADVQEATNSHYYERNGEYEVWTAIRETPDWVAIEQ